MSSADRPKPAKWHPRRLAVITRSAARARVAAFLARQPTYLDVGPVRIGQNVIGWQDVEWAGDNQAQVGSFFHGSVRVGRGTHFGAYSYITGDVTVGRYGSYGAQVAMISHDRHPIETPATYVSPLLPRSSSVGRERWRDAGLLEVGHDVWIGHGSTLLGAITTGHGAVVAANSVVAADVEPFMIVGGSPARPIRPRFDADIVDLLLQWAWWELDPPDLTRWAGLLDHDLLADGQRAGELLSAALEQRGSEGR
jgi:acetyltransferase-like isoleucine patch superfamily enzyme